VSRLPQVSASGAGNYIDPRLKVAGYEGNPLFTPHTLAMIHSRSDGIPRNINNLCFHALRLGFANGQTMIDASILNEVLEDLDIEMLGSGRADGAAVRHQAEFEGSVDPARFLA